MEAPTLSVGFENAGGAGKPETIDENMTPG
jgi:hypothetical protein